MSDKDNLMIDMLDRMHEEWLEEREMGYLRGQKDDPGFEIEDVEVTYKSALSIKCRGYGLATDPFNMGDIQEEWIPLSQLHPSSSVRDVGDKGTLVISTWLAKKKNLVEQ